MAPAGTYRVQLRVAAGGAASSSIGEASLEVRRDPGVRLTEAQWAELYGSRARAYEAQLDANALVRQLEDSRQQLEAARSRTDSTSAAAAQARQAESALDAVLSAVRGAQRGGQRGGGFGGGGAQAILQRLNSVAGAIGAAHFVVTAEQKQTLEEATAELARQKTAADDALGRARTALGALGRG